MLIAFGAMLVGLNVYVPSQYIVAVLAATAIYGMGYMAFRQPLIFHGENQPRLSAKYEGSTLTPDRGDEYLYRLRQTMENERPFLDPDLTVQKLANACTIPSYHLSQLLNERLGNTFYDFVNAHRIEEAKRLLCDPSKRHFSIFAIAQESGFNSKSVFNTAFKKLTGVPPSQFRNQSSLKT
jgi:AraC-like DNA-binding protein